MTFRSPTGIDLSVGLSCVKLMIVFSAAVFMTGCATERRVIKTEKGTSSSDELKNRFASTLKQERGEDGMMHASMEQRSDFDKMTFSADRGKEVGHKKFDVGEYKSKVWSDGDKSFSTKGFGDSDKTADGIRNQPDFVRKQFDNSDLAYGERGKSYKTNDSAYTRESWKYGNRTVDTFDNKQVKNTPKFEADIMDSHQYAKKTIEETNTILGRKSGD